MGEKVLILRKKKDKMIVKVRNKARNRYMPDEYNKVINPNDPNDLALFFEDLDLLLGSPVERAFRRFKERKEKSNPFF